MAPESKKSDFDTRDDLPPSRRTVMMASMTYSDLIVLVPSHSLEDFPTDLPDEKAEGLLNAFAVLWHPRLVAAARVLPSWHRADEPPQFTRERLIVVPSASEDRLPGDWAERARTEGAVVIVGVNNRDDLIRAAIAPLDEPSQATENNSSTSAQPSETAAALPQSLDPDLVGDFLALGSCHLQLELLTRHMHHFTNLDEAHLKREALAAADAALANDSDAARTHLRTCFEILLGARERFYPVDCYLIDLCLVIPRLADERLESLLSGKKPLNIAATASDLEAIAAQRPTLIDRMREAWDQETLDFVGGEYRERPSPLLPLGSVFWDFQVGHRTIQNLLGRTPVTWGRRRYGLSTLMPQILSRGGYHSALHVVLDDGIYPDAEHSKIRWEGCDGTIIDAITRIPLAGDSASSFLRFAARMAESMEQDQVAAVLFARWPEMKTPWLADLERMQAYAPVLGRFTTLHSLFQSTDDPGRMAKYESGEYLTPFLIQSVAGEERDPVSRYVDHMARRALFDSGSWCRRAARVLKGAPVLSDRETECERQLEEFGPDVPQAVRNDLNDLSAGLDSSRVSASSHDTSKPPSAVSSPASSEAMDVLVRNFATESARELAEVVMMGAGGQSGFLIFNPLSFQRTVTVDLPRLEAPPAVEGMIRGVQFDDTRRQVTLTLPGSGYHWLPATGTSNETDNSSHGSLAQHNLLRNEFFEVYINEETGGIAEIKEYGRRPNRLSQQLAFRFPRERTISVGEGDSRDEIRTYYSAMRCQSSEVTCAGPGMGEIVTTGEIVDQSDGARLAGYRQRVRVYRGRHDVELEIELDLARMPEGDPWSNYFAARFAWHDSTAALTRSLQQQAQPFTSERFESPYYLEIATESERTTILNLGLPFHRKTGPRMVDSILVAAGETRRRFQFRVAIDANYPMQAALDALSPPVVVETSQGPPRTGSAGWFFHLDAANIQIVRVLELMHDPSSLRPPVSTAGAGMPSSDGFAIRLVETEGRYRSATLRCYKTPTRARQRDLQGRTISELRIIDDGVLVELAGYEIADIELRFTEESG